MATESRTKTGTSNKPVLVRLIERVSMRRVLIAFVGFMVVYIYAPILVVIAFSFNSGGLTFPFVGLTTEWYSVLLENQAIIESTVRSLQLALVVTVITTVLSTATALAYRYDFWGQRGCCTSSFSGSSRPASPTGWGPRWF